MFNDYDKGPILVVAPHPDDETLGAGGLLLRAMAAGRSIHWLILTEMRSEDGWSKERISRREVEIRAVADEFAFETVHNLKLAAAKLDIYPIADVVGAIGKVVERVQPETLLIPHRGDAHSDHAVAHDAASACSKWFRYPSVRQTLVYEALSETDAAIQSSEKFVPNVFVDISDYFEKKVQIAQIFEGEMLEFPFPRSSVALKALSQVRGAACGAVAAEAFMLQRSRL